MKISNNKKILILIAIVIFAIFIIVFSFIILTIIDKYDNSLTSFNGKILVKNKEEFDDFKNNFNFKKLEIEMLLKQNREYVRYNFTEDNEKLIYNTWEFVKNANDPYLKDSGLYDITIYLDFFKENQKKYEVAIFKKFNSNLTYFIFRVPNSLKGGTSFSCFDTEGFIHQLIKHYIPDFKISE